MNASLLKANVCWENSNKAKNKEVAAIWGVAAGLFAIADAIEGRPDITFGAEKIANAILEAAPAASTPRTEKIEDEL